MSKTGGRQKGTPNKRTQEIQEKLEKLGCDPIEGLARIAKQAEQDALEGWVDSIGDIVEAFNPDQESAAELIDAMAKKLAGNAKLRLDHLHLATTCYNALRKHWAPELKSIEVSAAGGGGIEELGNDVVTRMAQAFLAKPGAKKPPAKAPAKKAPAKKAPAKRPASKK